jgi:hypothetical protein
MIGIVIVQSKRWVATWLQLWLQCILDVLDERLCNRLLLQLDSSHDVQLVKNVFYLFQKIPFRIDTQ